MCYSPWYFERICFLFLVEFFVDDDDEKWWSKLNGCKWLKNVSKTLHGAASLAKLLNFKNIELAGKKKKKKFFE